MKLLGRSNPPLNSWSIEKSLEDMDKGGVATSIVSPTSPQVTPLGREAAVRIARESNEFAAKMMADHPGRYLRRCRCRISTTRSRRSRTRSIP